MKARTKQLTEYRCCEIIYATKNRIFKSKRRKRKTLKHVVRVYFDIDLKIRMLKMYLFLCEQDLHSFYLDLFILTQSTKWTLIVSINQYLSDPKSTSPCFVVRVHIGYPWNHACYPCRIIRVQPQISLEHCAYHQDGYFRSSYLRYPHGFPLKSHISMKNHRNPCRYPCISWSNCPCRYPLEYS